MDRNQPKGVKRIVVVAMMALMFFTTAVGQDIYSGSTRLVVINSEWENVTLSGVKDGSLIAMLDCFNKKWPTWMVTHALKTMRKGQHLERYGEGLPTVFYEPQNGWVDVAAQPMGTEFIHVCYWKRTNGHRLFAIYLGKPIDPSIHFVCFYDYSQQKHTLIPAPHIIDEIRTTEDTKFYYELPREGKDLIITEYGPRGQVRHTFKWDGMKPVFSKSEVVEEDGGGDHCDEDEGN